jgi:hypothetical protein
MRFPVKEKKTVRYRYFTQCGGTVAFRNVHRSGTVDKWGKTHACGYGGMEYTVALEPTF